jgi:hypothetical protein
MASCKHKHIYLLQISEYLNKSDVDEVSGDSETEEGSIEDFRE